MIFRQLFEPVSSTYTYVLASRHGGEALIIDPVLERIDSYLELFNRLELRLVKAVDTHVHADHITAAPYVQEKLGGRTGISAGVVAVQRHFGELFNAEDGFTADGSQFDHLFADGETFELHTWSCERAAAVSGDGRAIDLTPLKRCPPCTLNAALVDVGFGTPREVEAVRNALDGAIAIMNMGHEPFPPPSATS